MNKPKSFARRFWLAVFFCMQAVGRAIRAVRS